VNVNLHPVSRRERDPPQYDRVGPVADETQVDGGDCDPQHLGHLRLRERGAEATADAAAERDPRVRLGVLVQEALRPELLRARVQVLSHVHEHDPGIHLDPGGELPAGHGPGPRQRPLGGVDHGP
jgi:hypothetical protein